MLKDKKSNRNMVFTCGMVIGFLIFIFIYGFEILNFTNDGAIVVFKTSSVYPSIISLNLPSHLPLL